MPPPSNTPDVDHYAVLGVDPLSALPVVSKSYKKLALKYHPDKTAKLKEAEQKVATDRFIQIKESWAVLSDERAKADYDEKLRGKLARAESERKRFGDQDTDRARMKKELERREMESQNQKHQTSKTGWMGAKKSAEAMQNEAEQMKESYATLQKIKQTKAQEKREKDRRTVKVKWKKSKVSHSEDTLISLLRPYGDVESVEMSDKGNAASVTFSSDRVDLEKAVADYEKDELVRLSYVGDRKKTKNAEAEQPSGNNDNNNNNNNNGSSNSNRKIDRSRETVEQMKIRQARERLRLIKKMEAEEEGREYVPSSDDEEEGAEAEEGEAEGDGENTESNKNKKRKGLKFPTPFTRATAKQKTLSNAEMLLSREEAVFLKLQA
ncbi:hypothetical protein TrVE_jg3103 [Triparma verrucosa]|uniref:J domain-containing protein n=1 Tax=Triparma verrucosa TaxID=1606542 RepID=A0A9W7FID1_9STRA|nr:hypothetical protein TrVE_jg3103 [Triparma verrucosa]